MTKRKRNYDNSAGVGKPVGQHLLPSTAPSAVIHSPPAVILALVARIYCPAKRPIPQMRGTGPRVAA